MPQAPVSLPQLQQGFEIFANWQTAVFCLAIYLLTQFIRTIIENAPKAKVFAQGWFWQTILLPFGPVATGIILAIVCKKFPWPMPIANVVSAKVMYGAVCGMGCGWMYSRVRDWFGIAADAGHPIAQKVAENVMGRPTSISPPPAAFGPPKKSVAPPAPPPPAPPAPEPPPTV